MQKRAAGFTLIELMIVVVVVAILAAIALPAYQDFVRKSRRAEAVTTMLDLQLREEKWRANNSTYGAEADIWSSPPNLDTSYYDFAIVAATNSYTITATPQGTQNQDKQYGVACTSLTLDQNNTKGPSGKEACWRK